MGSEVYAKEDVNEINRQDKATNRSHVHSAGNIRLTYHEQDFTELGFINRPNENRSLLG